MDAAFLNFYLFIFWVGRNLDAGGKFRRLGAGDLARDSAASEHGLPSCTKYISPELIMFLFTSELGSVFSL